MATLRLSSSLLKGCNTKITPNQIFPSSAQDPALCPIPVPGASAVSQPGTQLRAQHFTGKKKGEGNSGSREKILKNPNNNLTRAQATPLSPALAPLCKSQSEPPCCTGNAASKKSNKRKRSFYSLSQLPRELLPAGASQCKQRAGARADSPWQELLIPALFIGARALNAE